MIPTSLHLLLHLLLILLPFLYKLLLKLILFFCNWLAHKSEHLTGVGGLSMFESRYLDQTGLPNMYSSVMTVHQKLENVKQKTVK